MASNVSDMLKEFLCIIPDKPNVMDPRKKVRQAHYEGIKPLVESSRLVAGGVMLQKHATEDKPVTFKGSMIIYTGASEEDVKNILREDIYARSGVWDLEKMKIISYISAIRELME